MQNLDKLPNLPMGVESDWSMLEHVSSVYTAIVLIPVHPGMYSRGLDWPTEQAKAWTAALVEPPQQAVVQLAHQPVHLAQPVCSLSLALVLFGSLHQIACCKALKRLTSRRACKRVSSIRFCNLAKMT